MSNPKELLEQRAKVWEQQKAITSEVNSRDEANQYMTSDEQTQWDAMDVEYNTLSQKIASAERMAKMTIRQTELDAPIGYKPVASNMEVKRNRITEWDKEQALKGFFMRGTDGLKNCHYEAAEKCGYNLHSNSLSFDLFRKQPKNRADIDRYIEEIRGTTGQKMASAASTTGGNLVPTDLLRKIEEAMLQFGGLRDQATVLRTASGNNLDVPITDNSGDSGHILAENSTDSMESVNFGKLTLGAHKYTSRFVRVSLELMQDSAFNLSDFIGSVIGERIARAQAAHFATLSSTATGPIGITSDVSGAVQVSTGQDTASALAITYAELLSAFYSLDASWRGNASWLLSSNSEQIIRKLVDTTGNPIWQPSMQLGAPSLLLGRPVVVNEDMPDYALNNRCIVFGDLSKYWIRDAGAVQLRVANERFIDSLETGFIGFFRSDARFLDASGGGSNAAIKVLTCGSST